MSGTKHSPPEILDEYNNVQTMFESRITHRQQKIMPKSSLCTQTGKRKKIKMRYCFTLTLWCVDAFPVRHANGTTKVGVAYRFPVTYKVYDRGIHSSNGHDFYNFLTNFAGPRFWHNNSAANKVSRLLPCTKRGVGWSLYKKKTAFQVMGSNSPRVSIPYLGDGTNQQLWPHAWYFHETVGKCEVHCWIHV